MKTLEIEGVANADGWSMVAIAPGDVETVFEPNDPGVIAVLEVAKLGVVIDPIDGLVVQLPVDAIGRKTAVEVHVAFFIVTAEYAGETVLERDDGAIEDAVGRGE